MRELTKEQKTYLKEEFFQHNNDAVGWANIADHLLSRGEAIVAGDRCIWDGGIGNFIAIEDNAEFVGCVRYIFNLEIFLNSDWYREHTQEFLKKLREVINTMELEFDNIDKL